MSLKIPNLKHLDKNNFFLLAGPCVVENAEVCFEIAEKVTEIALFLPAQKSGCWVRVKNSPIRSSVRFIIFNENTQGRPQHHHFLFFCFAGS